jgi:hypothetical protein
MKVSAELVVITLVLAARASSATDLTAPLVYREAEGRNRCESW